MGGEEKVFWKQGLSLDHGGSFRHSSFDLTLSSLKSKERIPRERDLTFSPVQSSPRNISVESSCLLLTLPAFRPAAALILPHPVLAHPMSVLVLMALNHPESLVVLLLPLAATLVTLVSLIP